MTDRGTVRIVILSLAVLALAGLGGTVWLIAVKSDPANIGIVSTHTGAAIGALTATLISTKTAPEEPAEVQVVNPPSEPVPTAEA